MSLTPAEIVALEKVSTRAWPAARGTRIGGWRLYASSGHSGRVNACWPLGDPGQPALPAIAAAEAWYLGEGLPCVFKIADAACHPEDLPARLARLGYAPRTETVMMLGPAGGVADADVRLSGAVEAAFAGAFTAAAPDPGDARERLETLDRVPTPRAFARLETEGETAAVGACAADGPWAGLFAMRTDARFRRRGLARRVLASLLAWAGEAGARGVWLQVEADNTAAIALYRAAGFKEAYRYSYWRR